MLLKPEPIFEAVEHLRREDTRVVLMCPTGRVFTQALARELAALPHLLLLCGSYEWVDERVREALIQDEISIGDYVLTNGSLRATQIVRGDGTARFAFNAGQLSFSQFGSALRPLDLASDGTLTLTNATGTAILYGNYTNTSGGTLAIHIASTTNTLEVSDSAKLSGSLKISFAPGFQLVAGQQITLLTADSVFGSFLQVTLPGISADGLGLSTSMTTTSVIATVVNYAAELNAPGVSTNGQFQFSVNGVIGEHYTVQTSTNLRVGNWIPVLTNASPFVFQETNGHFPQRFYRVIYAP